MCTQCLFSFQQSPMGFSFPIMLLLGFMDFIKHWAPDFLSAVAVIVILHFLKRFKQHATGPVWQRRIVFLWNFGADGGSIMPKSPRTCTWTCLITLKLMSF